MFLNKNQENLLIELSKQNGSRSITALGKKVYNTYISAYNNIELLKLYGYIEMSKKKNKVVICLTTKGIRVADVILSKRKAILSVTAE